MIANHRHVIKSKLLLLTLNSSFPLHSGNCCFSFLGYASYVYSSIYVCINIPPFLALYIVAHYFSLNNLEVTHVTTFFFSSFKIVWMYHNL